MPSEIVAHRERVWDLWRKNPMEEKSIVRRFRLIFRKFCAI